MAEQEITMTEREMAVRVKEHTVHYADTGRDEITWKMEQLVDGRWVKITVIRTIEIVEKDYDKAHG